VVSNGSTQAFSFLTHSNNTYTGMTTVNNATLVLRYPGSLPAADYSRLTVTNNGGVVALAGADTEDGFTPEQVRDLLGSGRFTLTNDVRAGVDTSLADMVYPYDVLPPFAGRLMKFGQGTLTLDGHADLLGDPYVWGGNLVVTNDVTINFNTRNFYFRPTAQSPSLTNHFGGRARIVSTDSGYNKSQPTLVVGQAGGAKAALTLDGTPSCRHACSWAAAHPATARPSARSTMPATRSGSIPEDAVPTARSATTERLLSTRQRRIDQQRFHQPRSRRQRRRRDRHPPSERGRVCHERRPAPASRDR
jgi:autotransporter-associated beta strand protein